mgnify:CR=1 FL=1
MGEIDMQRFPSHRLVGSLEHIVVIVGSSLGEETMKVCSKLSEKDRRIQAKIG